MKQVLLSLTIIMVVASLGAAGTYAGFVDTEVVQGNKFQAGSLELQLGDTYPYPGEYSWTFEPDEDYGENPLGGSVEATWHYFPGYSGGMEPGDHLTSRVYLRNWGTAEATSVDIECVNVNYDLSMNVVSVPKDAVMVIEYLKYWNNPLLDIVWTDGSGQHWNSSYIDDEDGDSRITLRDWQLHSITGLDPPPPNGAALDMKVVFDPPTNTQHPYYRADLYSGYKTNMTLIFTLE
jgi:predicted ribosomally synthesized peptide with SipW-like signal peptide